MDPEKADVSRGWSGAPCEQCVLARQCPAEVCAPGESRRLGLRPIPRSFKSGARLQREGERSVAVSFVKSGLLGIRQTGMDGVERAIAVIGSGYLIGQPSVHGLPAMMTIRALSSVSVCEFSASALQQLMRQVSPDFACMERYTRQSMGSLAAWSHLMRMPGLVQRLASALRLIAEFQPASSVQLPSQAMLAELLCVTRESVNRVWKDFEAQGIVSRRHSRAIDLDLQRLEQLSCARQ